MLIFLGKSSRCLGVGHRADDRETEFVRRSRAEREISSVARLRVGVEQLVAPNRLNHIGCAGDKMINRVGVVLAPKRVWVGPE